MLDTQGNMMIFLRWMLVVVQGLNFIVFEYIRRHCDNGLIFEENTYQSISFRNSSILLWILARLLDAKCNWTKP